MIDIAFLTVVALALGTGLSPAVVEAGATEAAAARPAAGTRVRRVVATTSATDSTAVRDSIHVLPEFRVESERIRSEARRRLPTAFVTELRTGESGRALETLSEVLGEAAGVRILQYGGLGAFSTVSLRGAPPGQVAVYLDGVPITSAAHGVVNLADLPATAVERIEVYRGLTPLEMGPATPGGAINLVTVSSPELREIRTAPSQETCPEESPERFARERRGWGVDVGPSSRELARGGRAFRLARATP